MIGTVGRSTGLTPVELLPRLSFELLERER